MEEKRVVIRGARGGRATRAIVLLCAVLGAACSDARPRNLVLITVDTLRADHLGSYGHERDTSPAIDALAASGVRFARAYATAPWTLPSMASIFTGLHPGAHGAGGVDQVLPGGVTTLTEILKEQGFTTVGLAAHDMLSAKNGFDQGFDSYSDAFAGSAQAVTTPELTREAVSTLRRLAAKEEPFFLFVHYFDPHYAYRGHQGVDFAPEQVGRLDGNDPIRVLRRIMEDIGPDEIAFVRDLYDEEIAITDRGIGQLLEALIEVGRADDTLVVFAADHGEEFFERGWIGHTRSLYEELVRIPLVIRDPSARRKGQVVDAPVSQVSIAPTILELLGIDAGTHEFHGPSLASYVRGAWPLGSADAAPVLTEVDYRPGKHGLPLKLTVKQGIVVGDRKLIRDGLTGEIELYDMSDDPGETRNLAPSEPEAVAALLPLLDVELERTRRGGIEAEARALSEEERMQLRELGYPEDEP
jgi:arylsulfatase A-like enzyme